MHTAVRPSVVALLRGTIYAAMTGAIAVVVALTPADLATLGPFAPPAVLLARWGEALLLDRRQPPQLGLFGGRGRA